jgi:hypothetical protein
VKFWDTSAIIPLCVDESYSRQMSAILTEDFVSLDRRLRDAARSEGFGFLPQAI